MKRARHKWTDEDDRFMWDLYPDHGPGVLAKQIGVSREAVRSRAKVLGVYFRGPRSWHRWTRAEDELVLEVYATSGPAALAERLGVTQNAVSLRAQHLGCHTRTPRNTYHRWTEEEVALVRDLYETHGAAPIAEQLGVSISAVRGRAGLLAIQNLSTLKEPRHYWTSEEDVVLRELYPEGGAAPVAKRLGLSKMNVRYRAQVLGVKSRYFWAENHSVKGFRPDLGHLVRSTWEANFARALQLLKYEYIYEPEVALCDDGKTTMYHPDFYIVEPSLYVEVKGRKYAKGVKKIKLFREQHPDKRFVVVDWVQYKVLGNLYKKKIPLWETSEHNIKTHPADFGLEEASCQTG